MFDFEKPRIEIAEISEDMISSYANNKSFIEVIINNIDSIYRNSMYITQL